MGTYKVDFGRKGEEIAAKHLKSKGFEIICRNFKYKNGEIDLICNFNNILRIEKYILWF